jgi:putative membrane protein
MKHPFALLLTLTLASPVFAATTPPALTDAQIAKAMVTINEGEIDAAKLAEKNAVSSDVKNFALMMETEHKRNEKATKEIAEKNKINMDKSDLSKSLAAEAKQTNKGLKKQADATFDQSYVGSQVQMHTKALDVIDHTLLPAVQNQELRDHISTTRKAVAMHLDHAKALQKAYAK